jgi:xylulokinase
MPRGKREYVVAIDLGTSGPKVSLFDVDGEFVDAEFERVPLLLFPGGGAEQRPEDWWSAVTKAAQRLLAKETVPADAVIGVNCTAQWSGTVPVDAAGRNLMNCVIWMDSRGAEHVKRVHAGPLRFQGYNLPKLLRWIRLSGGAPAHAGKDSLAHILYLKHERPEIYERTYKFLEPKDYLNLRLTGRFAASFDSITLHWVTDNRDVSRVKYDDRLLKMSTVDGRKLPELLPVTEILGPLKKEVAAEWGLPAGLPVVIGTPDAQSAAVGSGAVRDFESHFYIGTSSWLMCHVPFKKTDMFHNMGSLPSALPGKYLLANTQECAGACLNFLKDNIFYHEDELKPGPEPPDVFERLSRIAARVPAGSGKLIFTPWLFGERAPVDDHYIRGGFLNLSLDNTREHLVRAVFEGVAYNGRWLLVHVEKFVKRRLDKINIIGGGAQSRVWCQICADVFGRSFQQIKDPVQANARGAALLASLALGRIAVDDIPGRVRVAETFEPNPENRAIYDELFREFTGIYKCVKKCHARLNRAKGDAR